MDCIIDNMSLSLYADNIASPQYSPMKINKGPEINDIGFTATSNLLTSIIIYNRIFIDCKSSYPTLHTMPVSYNNYFNDNYSNIKPVSGRTVTTIIGQAKDKFEILETPDEIYQDSYYIAEEQYNKIESIKYTPIIILGALRYKILSQMLGLNYIPAPPRHDFLMENELNDNISAPDFLLGKMEQEVQKFINSIYSERGYININMPLISQYLAQNISKKENIIKEAIKLSNRKEIKVFREWLNDLQKALNSHNFYEVNQCLSLVNEAKELMEKEFKTKSYRINLTISLSPSIGGSLEIPSISKRNKIVMTLIKKICIAGLKNPLGITPQ